MSPLPAGGQATECTGFDTLFAFFSPVGRNVGSDVKRVRIEARQACPPQARATSENWNVVLRSPDVFHRDDEESAV